MLHSSFGVKGHVSRRSCASSFGVEGHVPRTRGLAVTLRIFTLQSSAAFNRCIRKPSLLRAIEPVIESLSVAFYPPIKMRGIPCTGSSVGRARRCRCRRIPCTCTYLGRARRCSLRRIPCTCTSVGRARRWSCPRSPCTCSSLGRARRWSRHRSPCTCSCVCCDRRGRRRRSPCTEICVCRAGISCELLPTTEITVGTRDADAEHLPSSA